MAGGVRARTTHLIGRFDAVQRRIIAIAGLGLAFRAGYILLAKRTVDTCGQFLCGDAFWYSASAKFLAHGHVYELSRDGGPFTPAADHPPLTTLLLAPVSFIEADATHVPQRLVMAVLGAAVVVGLGLLARRLAGDRAGTIAALVAAVNANLFMNDVLVMAETVAAACLVVLLFAAYRFIDVPSVRRAAILGALVGLAGLARAELLLYGPVLVVPLALWARPLRWSQRLGRVAVAGAAAVAVLVPWTAYNATRFERPVALSTNDGLTLLGANCPAVYGIDDPGGSLPWNLGCTAVVDAVLPADADQSEVAAAYRDAAIEFIGDHLDRADRRRPSPRARVGRDRQRPDDLAQPGRGTRLVGIHARRADLVGPRAPVGGRRRGAAATPRADLAPGLERRRGHDHLDRLLRHRALPVAGGPGRHRARRRRHRSPARLADGTPKPGRRRGPRRTRRRPGSRTAR
ncbi:MAG: glycosyltransferase family 39 protein [Acidimicrobiales bacterium]